MPYPKLAATERIDALSFKALDLVLFARRLTAAPAVLLSTLCKQPLDCSFVVSQPCAVCLLQNQVFFRPSPAVPQAHSQVPAHPPPLDPPLHADQLHMLAAKYPANPPQATHTPLLRPGAPPCPPEPTSLIQAGIPHPLPRLPHSTEQPLGANQEVVQGKGSWSGPAGTALSLRACLSRSLVC